MFASSYFEKSGKSVPLISDNPDTATSLIVVIPCIHEPDLLLTLESLIRCQPTNGIAEVIILINEPENCNEELSAFNHNTFIEATAWVKKHQQPRLRFFPVGPVKLPSKWAGVGLARKAGMDEALYRFDLLEKPGGIIVSLDADTLVEMNYLTEIENHFREHPSDVGATLPFTHQLNGLTERQARGILLYEKYLHYYKAALESTGYPHAIYTIGSAFSVTAEAYLKRGGMTRRKAGEDFYFLQTLTQQGRVGEVANTAVHPSARVSQRVPFGTGPAMKKWMEGSDELLLTYNPQAFCDLKILFDLREELYFHTEEVWNRLLNRLPEPVTAFLREENLSEEWRKLSLNCSKREIFCDRFFQDFNAFRILKFLNYTHPAFYQKVSLEEITIP